MNKLTNLLISFSILFFSSMLNAANETPYDRVGIIQEIHLKENIIVVSDEAFGINPQIIINKNNKQKIGLRHLSINMPIGYNIYISDNSSFIKEVWILDKTPVDESTQDD